MRRWISLTMVAVVAGVLFAAPGAVEAQVGPSLGAIIFVGDVVGGDVRGLTETGALATRCLGCDYQAGYRLAAGRVQGNDRDRVILDNFGVQKLIFDQNGTPEGGFITGPPASEGFAIGDINGGDRDEILTSNFVTDIVGIFDADGARLGSFARALDPGDGFAAGDTDGDGVDEILAARPGDGSVDILRADGTLVTSFDGDYTRNDAFAAGDVDGTGADEILVASDVDGLTQIFQRSGQTVGPGVFSGYSLNDGFAVGDIDGDGQDDIVTADDVTGTVEWFDELGNGGGSFDGDFDLGDGFAVGRQLGRRDIDADGIPDHVELTGIRNSAGTVVINLPRLGASPCRKTQVIEIDYMSGASDGHSHEPAPAALAEVEKAFDDAPVRGASPCPFLGAARDDGIDLFTYVDDSVAEQPVFGTAAEFNAVKQANFDPGLTPYVRYSLWVHDREAGNSSGGVCCFGRDGQDFLVSLGSWGANQNGTDREQANMFMHEYGHALGLGHGGGDGYNFKPNYLSIMNYWFNPASLVDRDEAGNLTNSRIDFSGSPLPGLDEGRLFEAEGITDGPTVTAWRDLTGVRRNGTGNGPLNWTGNDADGNGVVDDDDAVAVDLNGDAGGTCVDPGADRILNTTPVGDDVTVSDLIGGGANFTCDTTAVADRQTLPVGDPGGTCVEPGDDGVLSTIPAGDDLLLLTQSIDSGPNGICDTAAVVDAQTVPVGTVQRILNGHDDWFNLYFRGAPGAGPGPGSVEIDELPYEEVQEIQEFWDDALIPDRTRLLDPPVPGFDQGVLGVAVDDEHVYATHHYYPDSDPTATSRPGTLVVLDRDTLEVQRRVGVGFSPRSVAVNPVTDRIYVVNTASKNPEERSFSLSVIDRSSLTVLTTIPLGATPIDVAVNTRLNRIYVSNPPQRLIHVIDGATNTQLEPIRIGPGPLGLAVDETRNRLYVALSNRSFDPHVTALGTVIDDGQTTQILPNVDLGPEGNQPIDVAVDPETDRVYVANLGGGGVRPNVKVLDGRTRHVLSTIPLTGPARAIALNGAANKVFVAGDGQVHVIEQGVSTVSRRIPSGFGISIATSTGASRDLYTGDFLSGELRRFSHTSGTPAPQPPGQAAPRPGR